MKVVILAGGFGTRLSELTDYIPKPMVDIGGKPILWHIMNMYASYGFHEFILALGYKAEVIKEYFLNFFTLNSNFSIDLGSGVTNIYVENQVNWKVELIDTGIHSQTGGRLKRLKPWLKETFMATYGDGLANVDIGELVAFHKKHKRVATLTGAQPQPRFGGLVLNGNCVVEFTEKNPLKEGWINIGFFVFEPSIFDEIEGDMTILEKDTLAFLAQKNNLMAWLHQGFWHPMDTLRDRRALQALWDSGEAPWRKVITDAPSLEKQTGIGNRSYGASGLLAHSKTS